VAAGAVVLAESIGVVDVGASNSVKKKNISIFKRGKDTYNLVVFNI
jgi:sarcosine oxidase gamma subunit